MSFMPRGEAEIGISGSMGHIAQWIGGMGPCVVVGQNCLVGVIDFALLSSLPGLVDFGCVSRLIEFTTRLSCQSGMFATRLSCQ